MTITYVYGKNLYVNLTNRCPNACDFCLRTTGDHVGDSGSLWLEREPTKEEILTELEKRDLSHYEQLVSDLMFGRDTAPDFQGVVDIISISLNASTPETYDEICHSEFGLKALPAILEFTKHVKQYVPKVVMTVVDTMPPEELEACRQLCASVGAEYHVRVYSENWTDEN